MIEPRARVLVTVELMIRSSRSAGESERREGRRGQISKAFGSDVSDVNVVNVAGIESSRMENATEANATHLARPEVSPVERVFAAAASFRLLLFRLFKSLDNCTTRSTLLSRFRSPSEAIRESEFVAPLAAPLMSRVGFARERRVRRATRVAGNECTDRTVRRPVQTNRVGYRIQTERASARSIRRATAESRPRLFTGTCADRLRSRWVSMRDASASRACVGTRATRRLCATSCICARALAWSRSLGATFLRMLKYPAAHRNKIVKLELRDLKWKSKDSYMRKTNERAYRKAYRKSQGGNETLVFHFETII